MSIIKLSKIIIVLFLSLYFYSCQNKNNVVYDIEGNSYSTIRIGNQTWMAENLRVTKYQNGDDIGWGSDNLIWVKEDDVWNNLEHGAWCDYNNDSVNGIKYGHMYNWYAVSDERNIAPIGWHVATDEDWKALSMYLDNSENNISYKVAKSLASDSIWSSSNELGSIGYDIGKNNSTGFCALPGGYRQNSIFNSFGHLGYYAVWWCFSEYDLNNAYVRKLGDEGGSFINWRGFTSKKEGYYVRCVKNQE